MARSTIYIKNMVCQRCVRVVREELTKAGWVVHEVTLGRAVLDIENPKEVAPVLERNGFALLEDSKARRVEQVKTVLIELVRGDRLETESVTVSRYLQDQLRLDYSALSSLFSSMESITIERFFILQKIERVKEWLAYGEWTLSEMAYKLGYSSVAHLSSQFKQVTGMTPTEFKRMSAEGRKSLDEVR